MTKLEDLLVESIDKLNGAVEKGVEFSMEQAPDIINQALLWYGTVSAIKMAGFFLTIYMIYWINNKQVLGV